MKNKKLYNIIFAAVLIISAAITLFVKNIDVRIYVGYVLIILSLIALLYSAISIISKNIKKFKINNSISSSYSFGSSILFHFS